MDSEIEVDYAAELSDEISIASTTDSQRDQEYEVETILADRSSNGREEYLVKWFGYHTLKATWEPLDSFNSPETLTQWKEKKAKIRAGQIARFDVNKFQKRYDKALARHEGHQRERKALEQQKRARLENLLFQDESNGPSEPEGDLIEPPETTITTTTATPPPATQPENRLSQAGSPLFVSANPSPVTVSRSHVPLNTASAHNTLNAPRSSTHPEALHEPQSPTKTHTGPKNIPQPKVPSANSAISIFTAPQTAKRKSRWDARSRDTVPDASRLELLKPSQFPARLGDSHAMTLSPIGESTSVLNADDTPSTTTFKAPEPPRPTTVQAMGPPLRISRAVPQKRNRSPGPYGRRESPPRPVDDRGSGAERRVRSPGPYSRREPTMQADDSDPSDRSRQTSVYRSREYGRMADCYRPSSPAVSTPTREPPASLKGDFYRPSSVPASSISANTSVRRPDPRTLSAPTTSAGPRDLKATAEADQIARMPLEKFIPGSGIKTTNGYFFNKSEVLAHISFGPEKKLVGAVRLCGMDPGARRDVLHSKAPGKRNFEMYFSTFCTIDDYRFLCEQGTKEGMPNKLRCNAWMEGFEDTNANLFHMAEYLRVNNVLAIYYPAQYSGDAWLAFSSKSTDFAFLDDTQIPIPDGVPIRLAVRSPLPRIETLGARPQPPVPGLQALAGDPKEGNNPSPELPRALSLPFSTSQSSGLNLHAEAHGSQSAVSNPLAQTLTHATDPRLRRRELISTNFQQNQSQGMTLNQTHQQLDDIHASTAPTPETSVPRGNCLGDSQEESGSMGYSMGVIPAIKEAISSPQNLTPPLNELGRSVPNELDSPLPWLFETSLHMSVEELSMLPRSRESSDEPTSADMFYLHFPEDESGQAELKLMEGWLKLHDKKIWSNRSPAGWSKFYQSCKCGVVIFHESKIFDIMQLRPAVNKILIWGQKMNFWVIRIAQPLEFPDTRFCNKDAHFQSIFTRGSAFLITEDVFQDLRSAAMLICWFHTHQRSNPGHHKLVLFPDVMAFLDRKLDDPRQSPEDVNLLLTIVGWIMKANSVDNNKPYFESASLDINYIDRPNNNILSFTLPGYGSRSENEHPGIPKGLSQAERNVDHLVETFAGWTMLHSTIFKKSIIITTTKHDGLWDRWKTWGHIYPFTVNQFSKFYEIPEEQIFERLHKGDVPTQQASSAPSSPKHPPKAPRLHRHRTSRVTPRSPAVVSSPRETHPSTEDDSSAWQDQTWRPPSQQPGSRQSQKANVPPRQANPTSHR